MTLTDSAEAEMSRAAIYQLLGGLLLECPAEGALRDVRDKELLLSLATTASNPPTSDALRRMHEALGAESNMDPIRADYAGLFLGVGKAKAPPWESVYRSQERLVWQEPAYRVLEHYARVQFGYDDMKVLPPDHVGRELLFVATLAAEAIDADGAWRAELCEAQRAFLREHLLAWLPGFANDVRKYASTEFYRALADALDAHTSAEGASPATPAASQGRRELPVLA